MGAIFLEDSCPRTLFHIFIDDLIGFIKKSSLYNFADDSTITSFEKVFTLFKKALQNKAKTAIQWFKM